MLPQLEQIALTAEDASARRAALRAIGEMESRAAFDVLSRRLERFCHNFLADVIQVCHCINELVEQWTATTKDD